MMSHSSTQPDHAHDSAAQDGPPSTGVSARLEAIAAEFADLEPQERLELLLDFANSLPPLPPEYQARKAAGENRVHECMTPVFLWVELQDGRVAIRADVAEEAPTVKGFVSILAEAFSGLQGPRLATQGLKQQAR